MMTYRGQCNWPPVWLWIGKGKNKYPTGEVGILKKVSVSTFDPGDPDSPKPYNRIYLTMEYLDARYMGCLLFDDAASCMQIGAILAKCRGRRLAAIGDLDLSQLL